MTNMLSDIRHLGKKAEALRTKRNNIDSVEAWAEACFRIAVSPQTDPTEGIKRLIEAYTVDGTNPRYPYHIARLFFSLGDFDNTARWLTKAVRLCPTSHRLWAHVSILHYELNDRYKGNYGVEPDWLKTLSKDIFKTIAEGKDAFEERFMNFTPSESQASKEEKKRQNRAGSPDQPKEAEPEDPAAKEEKNPQTPLLPKTERLQHPGKCRWSGIFDLAIERLLEIERSDRIKTDLLKDWLPQMAGLNATRRGKGSSFVIAAIQWLLRGYPVASIRRISKESLASIDGPAVQLLDLVCNLYEAPLDRLPWLLSQALTDNRIPPLIAALIHHQRLLWRPIKYGAMGAYRTAKKLLEQRNESLSSEQAKKVKELIGTLIEAAKNIDVPPPPVYCDVQDDGQKKSPDITDSAGSLKVLAETIKTKLDQYWVLLQEIEKAKGSGGTLTDKQQAGATEVIDFIEVLDNVYKNAMASIAKLRASGNGQGGSGTLTIIESSFKNQYNRRGRYKTAIKNLQIGSATTPPPHDPAAPPSPQGDTKEKSSAAGLIGLPGLATAVAMVTVELSRIFEESIATFAPYTAEQKHSPDFQILQLQIYMQAAETMYFMGLRDRAHSLWIKCLEIDRLFLPALKNISVCAMMAGQDHSRSLQSWKRYVEVLYFHAIAGADPKISARERAEFHAAYASAFGHGFIYLPDKKDDDPGKQDQENRQRQLVELLNSPGSLREFVEHKRAEFLNRWFEMQTPTLLLGVARTGKKELRASMKETIVAFVKKTCATLPDRIGSAFEKTCVSRIENAAEFCGVPENMTLVKNPRYHDDEGKLEKIIRDIYELKRQFCVAFCRKFDPAIEPQPWEHLVKYLDFIQLLDEINSIPIGTDDVNISAATVGFNKAYGGKERLDEFLSDACKRMIIGIQTIGEDKEKARALFERVVANINEHPDFWKRITDAWEGEEGRIASLVDDPSHAQLYEPEIMEILKSMGKETPPEAAKADHCISLLMQWCKKYPLLTGPAQHLAILLCRRNRHSEAVSYLESAAKHGFCKEGRGQCRNLLKQLVGSTKIADLVKKKDFAGARDSIISELAEDPGNNEMISQLINVSMQMIQSDPSEAYKRIDEIERQITGAIDNFKKSLDSGDDRHETIAQMESGKRQVIAVAASGFKGSEDLQNVAKCKAAIKQLTKVLEADRNNITAAFYLMLAHFTVGFDKLKNNTDDKGKSDFDEALTLAERIESESSDDGMKEQCADIKKKIEEFKSVL